MKNYDLISNFALKNIPAGLRASAQRGCMNIFQSYTRRTPTNRLAKHDEVGLGLMHYAAVFNRPLIVSSLVLLTVDVNIKQQIDYVAHGPMPLHYAARCGSLDTISCLIANFANITFTDHDGWVCDHFIKDNIKTVHNKNNIFKINY